MDRMQELQKHITKEQRGIEIGPYHNPIAPRRLGYNSVALDVFSTAELRTRAEADTNIPREHLAYIEDVDLQGSAGEISELVRQRCGNDRFDYVLSSHNLEHLPDPLRFLQGCEQVLKPGGVVTMAVPDRRFCFDFYRPVTELTEWLDAYHERRTKPTPGQVFRQHAYHSLLDGKHAWSPGEWTGALPTPLESLEGAFLDWETLTKANGEAAYRDCHCWAFTPSSFELLIADLRHVGLLRLETLEVYGPYGCEFYAHLRNPSGNGYKADRAEFYKRRAVTMRRAAQENQMTLI